MDIKRVRRWFLFLIVTSLLAIILLILSCFQFSDVADPTLRLEWKKIPSKQGVRAGVVSQDTDRILGQTEELVSKHHTSYQKLRKHRLNDRENYARVSNSFFHLTPDSFQTNLAEHSRKHKKGSEDEDELENEKVSIHGTDDKYSVEESVASSKVFTEGSWVSESQAGETVQQHHLDHESKIDFNQTTDILKGKVGFEQKQTKLKDVRNFLLEKAVVRSRKGTIMKEDVVVEPMANYTNMLPVSEMEFLRLKAEGVLRRNISRALFNMAPEPFLKTPLTFSSQTRSSCWFVNDVTISSRQRMRCLPYFYLIGMPKCGTTDLYDKITRHPSVHYIQQKEPHWWTRRRFGQGLKGLNKSYDDYLDHFDGLVQDIYDKGMPERMVAGDGSASTMWQQSGKTLSNNLGLPELFRELQPEVKLIAILREPVQRVFSDYLYFHHKRVSAKTFHNLVLAEISSYTKCCQKRSPLHCAARANARRSRPTLGLYSIFLIDWLKVFPRDQMLISRLQDWNANCLTLLPKIYSFLELETLSDDFIRSACTQLKRNVNSKKKFPMLNETAEILTDFYQPYNQELAALLKDDRFLWLD